MTDLKDYMVSNILPSSIAEDENIKAISKATDEQLKDINQKIRYVILLARIEEQEDAVLDELAWHFHVDFYREDLDRAAKINLIRTSISDHRLKGTPYAVKKVCTDIFKSAQVVENWNYGGEPYHFKVNLIEEPTTDENKINMLIDMINATKNARSWCDEVGFITKKDSNIYFGGSAGIFDIVEINPIGYTLKDVVGTTYFGGTISTFDKVEINAVVDKSLQDANIPLYFNGKISTFDKVEINDGGYNG